MSYRFFISPHEINWQEKKAEIADSNQTYKISRVLRLRENDQIVLLDGKGLLYNAQISSFYSRKIQCRLLSRRAVNTEPELKITIAQALLKSPKFDYFLQKGTEIGIYEFIPVTTQRTVIKISENEDIRDLDRKTSRFQKIVQDAAEQSERGITPNIRDIISLDELCRSNLGNYDLKLLCQERTGANTIKDVLNSVQDKVQKCLILIGPEGGFIDDEIKTALQAGFISVGLGKRIYRAETVSMVISSILFYFFNELK